MASAELSPTSAVASRIRDVRTELGLSQTEFAKKLSVSRSHISEVENNSVKIPIDLLFSIERVFGKVNPNATIYKIATGDSKPVPWGDSPGESPLNAILGLDERALKVAVRLADTVEQTGNRPDRWQEKAGLIKRILYTYMAELMRSRQEGADSDEARQKANNVCDKLWGALARSDQP